MSDQIVIAFSETERVAQSLTQAGDNLFAAHDRLANSIETLYASGLQGAFLDHFVSNNRMLLNTINRLAAETFESGTDLQRTVTNFRALDAECAAMFASYGLAGSSDLLNSSYGLGNYTWDLAELVAHFATRTAADPLGKGAGDLVMEMPQIQYALSMITQNPAALKLLTGIGGGVAGGLMDFAFDSDDQSAHNFFTQLISGGIQGGVGTAVPVVGAAMLLNTGVQFGGHLTSQVVFSSADALAGGDTELADIYRTQAKKLDEALDRGNLDNAFDSVVSNVLDIFEGNGDIGTNLGDAAQGIGDTIAGVAEISYEFQSMGTLVVDGTMLRAGNAVMDAVGVDDQLQAQINQIERMNLHDIQDIDLGNLDSIRQVAERRYVYFQKMLNL